jgi:signal transduction histidine kinase/CHASE3 domain sensor protein
MNARFILRMTAPMVGVSLLLLAIGIVAAWYIHTLQKHNSDLMAMDVASMLAAEDLEIKMRDVSDQLREFLRTGDRSYLDAIRGLRDKTQRDLDKAREFARTDEESRKIADLARGCEHFFERVHERVQFEKLHERTQESAEAQTLQYSHGSLQLIDDMAKKEVFKPAHEYVEYHRQIVKVTSDESQRWADLMGLGLLLLGACGSVGGMLAGFGIARGVNRSIVQLSVPVRGAAGKLNEVVGPITLSTGTGFEELEDTLQKMAEQVGAVVERLEQREREVLRGEQLAAVGQLAAGVAHELRNPLMAIKILVQAAAERELGGALQGRDLQVVEEEISRLEQSIQSLLDFARPPLPEMFVFDARELVQQTLDLVSARAEQQGVSVEANLPDAAVTIEADRGQIRQVLLNLLLNALDAMPEGGAIEVRLSYVSARLQCRQAGGEDQDLLIPGLQPADDNSCAHDLAADFEQAAPADQRWVVITVADDGEGLPADLGERIFEPFVSSKETGTGLGLPICRRIISAHGGELTAKNQPQGGAVFAIWLPPADSLCAPAAGNALTIHSGG